MKITIRFLGATIAGLGLLTGFTAWADGGSGGGHGGGRTGGNYGAHGNDHGGSYYRGSHGGSGWSRGGHSSISVGFGWPYYYDYYAPTYYYAPAPVIYSVQPQVIYTTPPVVDYSSQATAPTTTPSAPTSPTQLSNSSQPMSVADIKALAKGGLSDEVILSQIRSRHAAFRLTTEEILDLHTNQVSQKVLDYMINTTSPQPN